MPKITTRRQNQEANVRIRIQWTPPMIHQSLCQGGCTTEWALMFSNLKILLTTRQPPPRIIRSWCALSWLVGLVRMCHSSCRKYVGWYFLGLLVQRQSRVSRSKLQRWVSQRFSSCGQYNNPQKSSSKSHLQTRWLIIEKNLQAPCPKYVPVMKSGSCSGRTCQWCYCVEATRGGEARWLSDRGGRL